MLDLDALLDLQIRKLPAMSDPEDPGYLFFTMFFGQARNFQESCPFVSSENSVTGNLNEKMLRKLAEKFRNAARTLEQHADRVDRHKYSIEVTHHAQTT